jgi:hypothetical protein
MGLLTWVKDRIRSGIVPYGGTLSTPTDDDIHPIAIANELLGGLHGYRTLEELAQVPVQRLTTMLALVEEHVRPDGSVMPKMLFIFSPAEDDWNAIQAYERIADISQYDLSVYWKPFIGATDPTGDIQYQYAAEQDYGGVSGPGAPAFQLPIISPDSYQLGYKSDADHTVIWENTINELTHTYFRQRIGDAGKWGIPIKRLTESYSQGDYVDNQFKWVAKGVTPATPKSLVNGVINNNPSGWQGTPEIGGGIDYYTYIQTHDLFRITATKDAYQNLKSEWSPAAKLSTDPQLIRYGNSPSSTSFINADGSDTSDWRGYYTPGKDTHMAIRVNVSSSWRIENIDNESGEYVDFIFKAFLIGYEPTEVDRPTTRNPFSDNPSDHPNTYWKDYPFEVAANEVLHRSVGRKYNNGDLKPSGWSIPTKTDGQDILQVVIEPQTASTFKYDHNKVVTPASIRLIAKFFKGNTEIVSGVNLQWFKGDYQESNQIIDGGAGISQYHDISGARGEILDVLPEAVINSQLYTVRAFFEGEDYFDTQALLDVSDSQGYLAVIESNDGFIYKNQTGSKTFTGRIYNNGIEVDPALLTFAWHLGAANITPLTAKHQVSIEGSDFTDKEVIRVTILVDGKTFSRTETIVDLEDAKATIWQFTTQATTPTASTTWTTSPSGAVWARISLDGGLTFGDPFKVKGESAPYNGGFYREAYKNATTKPIATGVTSSLLPTGSGWTPLQTEPAPGDHVWKTSAFFTKIGLNQDGTPNTNVTLSLDNWTIQGSWGAVVRVNGVDGNQTGPIGPIGKVGWSPVLATITRSTDEVHRVVDWLNLGGAEAATKPPTGFYISTTGYVSDISQAKNIKGSPGLPGGTATGGNKLRQAPLMNNNNFVAGTRNFDPIAFPDRWGRIYSNVTFTTPAEPTLKPYISFTIQISGDGGGADVVQLTIQRGIQSGASINWQFLGASQITCNSGSYTPAKVEVIDSAALVNTLYHYRLVAFNVNGGNNHFSQSVGHIIFLVPG